MDYKGPYGITVLEGLEAVRRRPAMYIGPAEEDPSPRARLLEYLVSDIVHELAQEVRILLWCEGAISVAYNGTPGQLRRSASRPRMTSLTRPSTNISCI